MTQLFANNAFGSLAVNASNVTQTLTLATGTGVRFPSPTNGDYFLLTLIGLDSNGNESSWEIVKVTTRTVDSLTIIRAQENTTALAWVAGTRVELRATSGTFTNLSSPSPTFLNPNIGTPASGNVGNCTVDGVNLVGFRNVPVNSQILDYTLVLNDYGRCILHPVDDANTRTFTIPANSDVAYPIGTTISFINMSVSVLNIVISTDVMYLAGSTSNAARALSQNGIATAQKVNSTTWLIFGIGLS